MKTRDIEFDYSKAIPAAVEMIWKDRLKRRKEGHDFRGDTFYFTSTDVERQVRQFGVDEANGKRWGTSGLAHGQVGQYSDRGEMLRFTGGLSDSCRAWLLYQARNGRLESHNHGRGHISGMRFRPAGEPLTAAEEKAKEERAKPPRPRPQHKEGPSGGLLCMASRPRSIYSRGRRRHGWKDWEHVTCPRCLKLKP